jgi:hypothetical protein
MNGQADDLKRRNLARGPKGELLSWLTGKESEAEIRKLIIKIVQEFQFATACPVGKANAQCPFRAMAGLSYHSMKELAETMPIQDCIKLFELELECRTSGGNKCCSEGASTS